MMSTNSEYSTLNNKIILIAEDEPLISAYFKAVLNPYGVQIIWASNGKEAVTIFESRKDIDIILMDIRMPEMDGYEAIRQILKIDSTAKIIAQTAYATTEEIEKCFAAGCIGYISKPINSHELITLLNKHI